MKIGIIVAMDKELAGMKDLLTDAKEETDGNFTFHTGRLNDKQIGMVHYRTGRGRGFRKLHHRPTGVGRRREVRSLLH